MISAVIAEQLCAHGHDVEAVSECAALRGMTDDEVFEYAQTAQRSLVTTARGWLTLRKLYHWLSAFCA
jgi:sulfur relay (sulfurtransferase) complex TusBCD TusD component (DsrE family)